MLIELETVTKIYEMGSEKIHALDEVSLGIGEGEFVAVMGPSGSGKSTLMNILGCLDRPSRGRYRLDGRLTADLSSLALARVRNEQVGFVFQTFELLPRMTALKNVEMPLVYSRVPWRRRRELAESALERVGLSDRASHRPSELSGGQRQRVALARALVCSPRILLADEPTGNLDSKTSAEILALFEEIHFQGQTVLMVTHEADVAAHARRVLRMKDGRIESDLPVEEDPVRESRHVAHAAAADQDTEGGSGREGNGADPSGPGENGRRENDGGARPGAGGRSRREDNDGGTSREPGAQSRREDGTFDPQEGGPAPEPEAGRKGPGGGPAPEPEAGRQGPDGGGPSPEASA